MKRFLGLLTLFAIFFSCTGANLLFKDSFEGNTTILTYNDGTQWWSTIRGVSDTLGGLVWPNDLPSAVFLDSCVNQYQLFYDNQFAPTTIVLNKTPYTFGQTFFAMTTGRFGTPTTAWYARTWREEVGRLLSTGPDIFTSDAGTVRTNWVAFVDSTLPDWQLYQSMWLKFNDNLIDMYDVNNTWKFWDLWEYKSFPNPCDPDGPGGEPIDNFNFDTRIACGFQWDDFDGIPPFTRQIWWTCGQETLNTVTCEHLGNDRWNRDAPNTVVGMVPGQWFKFETFVKSRSDNTGRIWIRINNHVLVDTTLYTYRPGFEINKWNLFKNYVGGGGNPLGNNVPFPTQLWVDELEFWDDIPNP
jgi:hypothetical protein